MSYCLQPRCQKPLNPDAAKFCENCGAKLLLKDLYRAIAPLGQGGFGRTFQAINHGKFDEPCVIKQFLPQVQGPQALQKATDLFLQEAKRLHELGTHPQIPTLYAYFEQDQSLYLIQEFVDGPNLLSVLATEGAFNEAQIRELLLDLLPVLAFMHERQIIHRDLKPENVIRRQRDRRYVIVDFGSAKVSSQTALNHRGTKLFTSGYSPPEQEEAGQAFFASDLYSLGATCLHLLTHRHPSQLFDYSRYQWQWRETLNQNPISDTLGQILDRLVERPINRRYNAASEVLQALQPPTPHLANPQLPTPHPQSNQPPTPNPKPPTPNPQFLPNLPIPTYNPKPLVPPPPLPRLKKYTFQTVAIRNLAPPDSPPAWTLQQYRSQARYLSETLSSEVQLDMVVLPGGVFWMGAPETEAQHSANETPRHPVAVAPFLISKFPITQAQYAALMGTNPSRFKGSDRPVESVSWQDAVNFCQRLEKHTQRPYRLPSEAEWEYACRAGTVTPFSFGETLSPELANYDTKYTYGQGPKGKSRQQTTPVGEFPPNAFGLYDLHGNVWEWCADPWHDSYQDAPNDARIWDNSSSNERVLRGGSWNLLPKNCRSAFRNHLELTAKYSSVGFRVVCTQAPKRGGLARFWPTA